MNILLQFKKKSHADAYSHDLQLQVSKRLIMISIWALMHVVGKVSVLAIFKTLTMTPLEISRTVTVFVLLIGLIALRCNLQRTKKYQTIINLFLDLCLIYAQFIFYPLIGRGALEIFTKLGVFMYSWITCVSCIATYLAFANWWIRLSVPIIQMIYILVPTVQQEHKLLSPIILVIFSQCIFVYGTFIYIYELYQRKDFLEKRKVYENYEAILRIFDDIIQGIMIVDRDYNLIYSNRTFNSMFNHERSNQTVGSLFSQIQVKSINPQLDTLTTERVLTTTQDESVIHI